jgi:hypothetical protein
MNQEIILITHTSYNRNTQVWISGYKIFPVKMDVFVYEVENFDIFSKVLGPDNSHLQLSN